jgi:hypothetical protein
MELRRPAPAYARVGERTHLGLPDGVPRVAVELSDPGIVPVDLHGQAGRGEIAFEANRVPLPEISGDIHVGSHGVIDARRALTIERGHPVPEYVQPESEVGPQYIEPARGTVRLLQHGIVHPARIDRVEVDEELYAAHVGYGCVRPRRVRPRAARRAHELSVEMDLARRALLGHVPRLVEVVYPAIDVVVVERPVEECVRSEAYLGILLRAPEDRLEEAARREIGLRDMIELAGEQGRGAHAEEKDQDVRKPPAAVMKEPHSITFPDCMDNPGEQTDTHYPSFRRANCILVH